ncbi:MAG: GerW family sporulation protein [Clostridia bacterium]
MAEQHPIENLMLTAMTSLESMVDVNTIVGDMLTCADGTVIIPVSKVSFGFAAGGSEFNTNKLNKFSDNTKLPFGGGSGAGVNISPMAFLVVKDGNTRIMTLNSTTPIDKLIDLIPDIVDKANIIIEKIVENPKKVLHVVQDETNQLNDKETDE